MSALDPDDPSVDVLVPDGRALAEALARTTVLGVGAHPDDLELMAIGPIAECRDDHDRWFTGVTVTDGAGSVGGGPFAGMAPEALVARRRQEQRNAARIGAYGLMVQLGRPSTVVRDPGGRAEVAARLAAVVDAARPELLVTHNPVDRHPTHVAVVLAVVEACRSLPAGHRPARVLGMEGWRSLDWLPEADKVRVDVSGHRELARRLAGAHTSQLSAKRYDLAEEGRRRANATLDEARAADIAEEVQLALDLTPLVRDDGRSVREWVAGLLARFSGDVGAALEVLGADAAPPPGP